MGSPDRRPRRPWLLPPGVARRAERDIREEVDLYIELRARELREEGLSETEALRRARAAFGDVDEIIEDCMKTAQRDYWSRLREELLGSLIRDVRFAFRTLRRSPRFVFAVCLTLALGIGANSAIFSVVNAVALQPLPYPEADRLFRIWTQFPEQELLEFPASEAEYLDYAAESELFERMGAYAVRSRTLTGQGAPRSIPVAFLSAPTWELLGARAAVGRLFDETDDRPGAPPVAVVAYSTYRGLFGADESILGREILLDGNPVTVVGVTAPDFSLPDATAAIYRPLGLEREAITDRSGHYLAVVGRAAPGVERAAIRAEMSVIGDRWTERYFHSHPLDTEPLREQVVGDAGFTLLVLLGAVGAVLLVACANVAGLMLARAVERRREMGIRTALGAGRGDLTRQLLVEGLLLAGLAGLLGILLASAALPLVLQLEPGNLPRLDEVGIDGVVVAFTVAVSLLCGLGFSLVPALRASSLDPSSALAAGGRDSGGSDRRRALGGIVIAEVALALVLVAAAGLLVRSFIHLSDVDPGLRVDNVYTARVGLPPDQYRTPDRVRGFFDQLHERLAETPGVEAVGSIRRLPLAQFAFSEVFLKQGEAMGGAQGGRSFEYQVVGGDYFKALGIEILAGRDFHADDRADTRRVAIVNETLAERHFPGQDPVGHEIRILASEPDTEPFLVVGVTEDVLQEGPGTNPAPQIYVPHRQATGYSLGSTRSMVIAIRSTERGANPAERLRTVMEALDPDLAITGAASMESVARESLARPRFVTLLLALLAGLALLLAAVGVYSVVAYGVARRTREFGIRMALGARPGQVVGLVLRQGIRPAILGTAVGLALALLGGRALSSLLFATAPHDPVVLTSVAVGLLLVAALAAWLPARRALRVETVEALSGD